jgi:hypothetical protein
MNVMFSAELVRALYACGLTGTAEVCEEGCTCEHCDWWSSPAPLHVQGRRSVVDVASLVGACDAAGLSPTERDAMLRRRETFPALDGPYQTLQLISRVLHGASETMELLNRLFSIPEWNRALRAPQQSFQVSVSGSGRHHVARLLRLYRRYWESIVRLTGVADAPEWFRFPFMRVGEGETFVGMVSVSNREFFARHFGNQVLATSFLRLRWGDARERVFTERVVGQHVLKLQPDGRVEFRFASTTSAEHILRTIGVCVGLYRASAEGFSREQLDAPLLDFVRPYLARAA